MKPSNEIYEDVKRLAKEQDRFIVMGSRAMALRNVYRSNTEKVVRTSKIPVL